LYLKRYAFTMIELVFVIVVLGILAAIAVPKFAATRTDAQIAKGRTEVSAIRSAIVSERQTRLIRGQSNWISSLSTSNTTLFDGNGTSTLLMYGVTASSSDGHWSTRDAAAPFRRYRFKIGGKDCDFDYNVTNGRFGLENAQPAICNSLVN
jgi:general secretion pathway protein G